MLKNDQRKTKVLIDNEDENDKREILSNIHLESNSSVGSLDSYEPD